MLQLRAEAPHLVHVDWIPFFVYLPGADPGALRTKPPAVQHFRKIMMEVQVCEVASTPLFKRQTFCQQLPNRVRVISGPRQGGLATLPVHFPVLCLPIETYFHRH